jgi:hypothetical protein
VGLLAVHGTCPGGGELRPGRVPGSTAAIRYSADRENTMKSGNVHFGPRRFLEQQTRFLPPPPPQPPAGDSPSSISDNK